MTDYKFDYTVSEIYNRKAFEETCRKLDSHIPPLEKGENIRDEDGSEMQFYYLDKKKLAVHIVDFLDIVYITSEFDAEDFLKNSSDL